MRGKAGDERPLGLVTTIGESHLDKASPVSLCEAKWHRFPAGWENA